MRAEIKVAQGKLIIKGTLCVTTLYLGDMDENVMQFMEHEFAFTEIIDRRRAGRVERRPDFTVINVSSIWARFGRGLPDSYCGYRYSGLGKSGAAKRN